MPCAQRSRPQAPWTPLRTAGTSSSTRCVSLLVLSCPAWALYMQCKARYTAAAPLCCKPGRLLQLHERQAAQAPGCTRAAVLPMNTSGCSRQPSPGLDAGAQVPARGAVLQSRGRALPRACAPVPRPGQLHHHGLVPRLDLRGTLLACSSAALLCSRCALHALVSALIAQAHSASSSY